jgi:hypothetical protein
LALLHKGAKVQLIPAGTAKTGTKNIILSFCKALQPVHTWNTTSEVLPITKSPPPKRPETVPLLRKQVKNKSFRQSCATHADLLKFSYEVVKHKFEGIADPRDYRAIATTLYLTVTRQQLICSKLPETVYEWKFEFPLCDPVSFPNQQYWFAWLLFSIEVAMSQLFLDISALNIDQLQQYLVNAFSSIGVQCRFQHQQDIALLLFDEDLIEFAAATALHVAISRLKRHCTGDNHAQFIFLELLPKMSDRCWSSGNQQHSG